MDEGDAGDLLQGRSGECPWAPLEEWLALCYIFQGSVDDFSPDSGRAHPRSMVFFEPLDA